MKKKSNTLTFVVIVAAAVAALTTAAIFLLRWRSQHCLGEFEDVYDDDFNDSEFYGEAEEEQPEEDQ